MAGLKKKLLAVIALSALTASAQWINYPEPDVPRTPDGKVDMSGPAPRTADDKPDLTGTWMHDPTPPDELRRIFKSTVYENELEVLPPGMNIELQTKYGLDLLIDYDVEAELKPGELPTLLMKPAGIEVRQVLSR